MHTVKHALAPSALLFLAAPTLASDINVVVDFESGPDGWAGPSAGGATVIAPTGGNGGTAGLQTIFSGFGLTFTTSANAAFLGDYTQNEEVTISVDTLVQKVDFSGFPVSRPWLLELRDYDSAVGGYPWSSVWYFFTDISEANHSSWTTFSVTIADPTSTTLPAGWSGYGAEDPVRTGEGGVDRRPLAPGGGEGCRQAAGRAVPALDEQAQRGAFRPM